MIIWIYIFTTSKTIYILSKFYELIMNYITKMQICLDSRKVALPPFLLANLSFRLKGGNLKGNSDYSILYNRKVELSYYIKNVPKGTFLFGTFCPIWKRPFWDKKIARLIKGKAIFIFLLNYIPPDIILFLYTINVVISDSSNSSSSLSFGLATIETFAFTAYKSFPNFLSDLKFSTFTLYDL